MVTSLSLDKKSFDTCVMSKRGFKVSTGEIVLSRSGNTVELAV